MARRILIVGGDGYCGWATALALSHAGMDVSIADNLIRREWDSEHGIASLAPLASIDDRLDAWVRRTGHSIKFFNADVRSYAAIAGVIETILPTTIVHFGQQRSAPFSMVDREHTLLTQIGNLTGTVNLLYAMRDIVPDVHLIKLGTMGEYGTPNIDIEEGYIEIEHRGRRDVLPFPKQPGSFYHLSKVHDSDNIAFAARVWNLRATDLNQGVVYGMTGETELEPLLANRFDYDQLFGTVLNRFSVQAIAGHPLTVYGAGGQTRGFIDLRDTVECVRIAIEHPPEPGRLEVLNQFTEQFSVLDLAERVERVARTRGIDVRIEMRANPRVEKEAHFYNAVNRTFMERGLEPHRLNDTTISAMLDLAERHRDRIDRSVIDPSVSWRPTRSVVSTNAH